jgi:hypothetical protein
MISGTDVLKLSMAVTEATGQEFSDAGAMVFASSLDRRMSLNDALHALAEWNSRPHGYYRVQPGELTAIWKGHKPSSKLSEAEIGRMLEPLDLTADELWAARRALIANVDQGMTTRQALSTALDAARGHELPAAPEKPKPTHDHHFAGRLRLGDVIGNQEGKTL